MTKIREKLMKIGIICKIIVNIEYYRILMNIDKKFIFVVFNKNIHSSLF